MEYLQKLHAILSPSVIGRANDLAGHGLPELRDVLDIVSEELSEERTGGNCAEADFYMFKQLAKQNWV